MIRTLCRNAEDKEWLVEEGITHILTIRERANKVRLVQSNYQGITFNTPPLTRRHLFEISRSHRTIKRHLFFLTFGARSAPEIFEHFLAVFRAETL